MIIVKAHHLVFPTYAPTRRRSLVEAGLLNSNKDEPWAADEYSISDACDPSAKIQLSSQVSPLTARNDLFRADVVPNRDMQTCSNLTN